MNTLITFAVILAVMFGAGVAVELRRGLKEDRKYAE